METALEITTEQMIRIINVAVFTVLEVGVASTCYIVGHIRGVNKNPNIK
ncbi:MAG: hypothetical protein IKR19_07980 [Acholeplasmatales bacterium]|nr:hypothetical protein [Acholeplasmatales bacterium]